ncbi:MAG: hypothetical protein J1F39_02050 [Clostridiales bacterium]|nr:hypothetical protein [Clostridiales bacterium]
MELHIKSKFDCVYQINGDFFERADSLAFSEFDVLYVTVLPIRHTLLPYTVKLEGARNTKAELYNGIRLDKNNYLLTLEPRHMTVYGFSRQETAVQPSPVMRLFSLIKNGDVFSAYAMLSESLKETVDKRALVAFFEGYDRIEECFWKTEPLFYLIDTNEVAHLNKYTLDGGLIDNIEEIDSSV